jgi:O-antigen ligase
VGNALIALADGTSRQGTKRWSSLPSLGLSTAAVGGVLCGLAVLALSQLPTRWQVYALAGVAFAVVMLAGQLQRRHLVRYFIIGVSLNVHYYLTQPIPRSFFGLSSPTYFSIPLVLIPAAALAVSTPLGAVTGRARLSSGLPVAKFAVLVIVTATISAMLSSVKLFGIFAIVEMLQYFFIYLVTVNIVRTEEDLPLVIRLLLVTLAIQCVVFLMETALGTNFNMTGAIIATAERGLIRATGTVGTTPSGYAIFVEPLVFTAFALWRARESGVSRVWTGCLTALGGATLILTNNRTSWLTLVLGISLVEILCRRRGIARQLSGPTVLSAVAAIMLAAMVVVPLILPRLHAGHGEDWKTRKDLMRVAVRMIARNPIVGVGPGNYAFHLPEYVPSDARDSWLWVVHNEYLLIWAERGLLGFVAWLAWMRAGFRQAILATRVQAREFQAFGIGCVAGMVGLFWEYMLNMWPPFSCYALLWCLFGVLVAGNDLCAKAERSGHPDAGDRCRRLSEVSVGR